MKYAHLALLAFLQNQRSYCVGICIGLALGCSTPKQTAVSLQTFNYDYKTGSPTRPGSANILVDLVRPNYASSFGYGTTDLFANFREHIGRDMEELLIDKGFRVKGPYDSFDDMVFDDRKDADVAIDIEIVPQFTARDGSWHSYTNKFSLQAPVTYYYYEGTVSLIGKINLIGYEPLSKEKIWVKSVPIPAIMNINITTANKKFTSTIVGNEFYNDPNVYNALGKALHEQYKEIFKKIDVLLDAREFEILKPQIKELKAKKGY